MHRRPAILVDPGAVAAIRCSPIFVLYRLDASKPRCTGRPSLRSPIKDEKARAARGDAKRHDQLAAPAVVIVYSMSRVIAGLLMKAVYISFEKGTGQWSFLFVD
jgi:hypothetical protein